MPPLRWRMATIVQLYSGNDDINRVAKLRTSSGHIVRSIVKLRKLPVDALQPIQAPNNQPHPLPAASSNSL